jgi:hypothetical protein
MKLGYICIVLSFFLLYSCKKDNNNDIVATSETLIMGSGYANDVYYSLDNGIVATVPRANWDIAFHTNVYSSTIITNGGEGVQLYAYKNIADSTAWNTVKDTAGLYQKDVLYNSDTTWTFGAFERTMQGFPDYGWGTYNTTSHDIIGTTLFIIKLGNNQVKKIMIARKYSTLNKYRFWYANIDGSGEQKVTLDCSSYTKKNFVYFSFSSNALIDREPDNDKWDFLMTKYIQMVPAGTGVVMPYPVVGVLSNTMRLSIMGAITYTAYRTAKLSKVNVGTTDYSKASFKTNISTIGYDWKTVNMSTGTYTLQDSLVYYISRPDQSVYKIVFTAFEGSSTGVIKFDKTKLK